MARTPFLCLLLFFILLPVAPTARGQQETYVHAPAQVGSTRYVLRDSTSPETLSGMICGEDEGCNSQTSCEYYMGAQRCRSRCYFSGCNCWIVYCTLYWPRLCYGQPCWEIETCGSSGQVCNNNFEEGDDCGAYSEGNQPMNTGYGGSELMQNTVECGNYSPILIDVDGDGYRLTDGAGGVPFDLNSDGAREQLSWTAAESDDAFLVLDRDGNGVIDNGRELFGNFTPQLRTAEPNGYLALAVFDRPVSGGNQDGAIDAADKVYADLRLWRDTNHNGLSEEVELTALSDAGITRLALDYKETRRTDRYGNEFRYRAVVEAKAGTVARWSWDVFLKRP